MPSLDLLRRLEFIALSPTDASMEMAMALREQHKEKTAGFVSTAISVVVLLAILWIYSLVLSNNFLPAIVHPDANGYWAQGARIFATGSSTFRPESDAQYIGMHWLLTDDQTIVARYPPVFPALIGFVWWLGGWEASVTLNPVLSVLTLLGVFLTTRRLCGCTTTANIASLAAVLVLTINAAFTIHALTAISHMPVACLLVWGMYFLLRWSKSHNISTVILAGFLLGLIPGTRYPDAIVAIGVGIFLIVTAWKIPGGWKHILAACSGAFVAILPLLIRNQLALGAFWRTGYALTNEQTGFSWEYFTQHAMGYLQLLQGAGLGPMFVLGLVGIICLIALKQTRAAGLMLLGTTVPVVILYMSYYWAAGIGAGGPMGGMQRNTIANNIQALVQPPPGAGIARGGPADAQLPPNGPGPAGGPGGGRGQAAGGGGGPGGNAGSMRFLVPVVPLFAIAGMAAIALATHSLPIAARIAAMGIPIALHATLYLPALSSELHEQYAHKSALAAGTEALAEIADQGSVIVASPQFLQQLDFLQQWKLADPSLVSGNFRGAGRMISAIRGEESPSPMQPAKQKWQASLYAGTAQENQTKFIADITKWADGKPIYIIGGSSDVFSLLPGLQRRSITEVKRIPRDDFDVPGAPQSNRQNARGAGRRGGGPFGPAVSDGDDIVIARVTIPAQPATKPDHNTELPQ